MEDNANELNLSQKGVKNIAYRYTDRVTADAVKRVMYEEENKIDTIFESAKRIAENAGRETVKEDDIRIVYHIMEQVE